MHITLAVRKHLASGTQGVRLEKEESQQQQVRGQSERSQSQCQRKIKADAQSAPERAWENAGRVCEKSVEGGAGGEPGVREEVERVHSH